MLFQSKLISVNTITKNTNYKTPETEISRLLAEVLKPNSNFLSQYKNKVFSVGGFVRDEYLNITSNDLDLAIDTTLTIYAGYVSADRKGAEVAVPGI